MLDGGGNTTLHLMGEGLLTLPTTSLSTVTTRQIRPETRSFGCITLLVVYITRT